MNGVGTAGNGPGGEVLLEARGVVKCYGNREVLRVDHIEVRSGEVLGLTGPNGAGKTTLLEILSGITAPTSGAVAFRGCLLGRRPRNAVALALQDPVLFRGTVRRNVGFALRALGLGEEERQRRVRDAMDTVGVVDLAERGARGLSGGERKRVSIAQAIALRPEVLLLDEPTAGVDDESRARLSERIRLLADERGTTVLFASHDSGFTARLGTRVLGLRNGRIGPGIENLYRGRSDGRGGIDVQGVGIHATTDRVGDVKLSVSPTGVVLSLAPLPSSMRNSLPGRVVNISEGKDGVRVLVDAGFECVSTITRESLLALGLTTGSRVYISFKSTAIRVY